MEEQLQSDNQYKIATVDVKDLEFLEKNARYMTAEMFQNLVDNVKRDGGLSSMPLCWKHGDKYKILSGNHRCAAAIKAGFNEITVMYTDRDLSKQEQIAIQLSHNAIDGKDDMVILKELWGELEDLNLKYYAGLDDKTLEEMENVSMTALSDAKLDFRSVTFLFLPSEFEDLEKAVKQASTYVTQGDTVYLNRIEEFKRLLNAQSKIQAAYNVKSSVTAMMTILDVFSRHQDELIHGYVDENGNLKHKKKVPLSSVFGDDYVNSEEALFIKKALDRAIDKGEIKSKKKLSFIKFLVEKYLAGE